MSNEVTIELTPEQEEYIKKFVDKRFGKDDPRREGYAEELRKCIRKIQLSDESKKN
jgi:hypothetical protein